MSSPPLMYYLTGYLFMIFSPLLGLTLTAFCQYMAVIYGAIAVIPAYFLGKEFSNKYAGLIAAFFVGLSPAILTRTMGGFYDTDGLVIFFSLLAMYLLVRAFRKRDYPSYAWAVLGLVLFGLTWSAAWYIPLIILLSIFVYLIVCLVEHKLRKGEGMKAPLIRFKNMLVPFITILITATVIIFVLGFDAITRITDLFIFAGDPAKFLIVNISVAELQNLDVFGGAWGELFVRIGIPFLFTIPGALLLLKRDRKNGAILLTWAGISFYAITRGIRFMLIFTPAACIASAVALAESHRLIKNTGNYAPLFSFGFIVAVLLSLINPNVSFVLVILLVLILLFIKKKDTIAPNFSKHIFIGAIIVALFLTLSQGTQAAIMRGSSEPVDYYWEEAYMWLKENSAEDAVVGSWWDPGHRISGIAERRNIADGAHCPDAYCDPGLNTRITHLGKIFVTDDENEAKELLLRYRGDASEIYWIVSDDLIGKFRWLQYFGTGCDGTGEHTPDGQRKCPLYSMFSQQGYSYNPDYEIMMHSYAGGLYAIKQDDIWVVGMTSQGKDYGFQRELTYTDDEELIFLDFTEMNESETFPGTSWLSRNKDFVVYIPPNLERALFTKMFFYEEDETLRNFELVYENFKIRIYRLVM